jgi:DNA invertase Pin-like site-specific DNA recombinase
MLKSRTTELEIAKLKMPSLSNVAAYARVSSGKDDMLHSLAAQVSYYSNYIQQHPGWIYAGVYTDEACTGTKSNRPDFKRLIEDCRKGKIDLVLTKSISRFARNTVDLLEAVRELKDLNVDVFFEEQNMHTMSGEGELMLTILASYAQEESRSVSENCKWSIRKRFIDGELVNLRFMYGYRIIKGEVEIEPSEAATVRMIFEDYIKGLGGSGIARKMRELGVQNPRGGEWNTVRVISIIKNEKYTGNALLQKRYVADHLTKRLVNNKGELPMYDAADTHPAIVSQELFDRAQAILNKRRVSCQTKNDTRHRYPFSGILQCGICGSKYKRKVRNGKVMWQCTTYLNEGKTVCPAKQIPEQVLYSNSSEVLNLTEFNADCFNEEITKILVSESNILSFVFEDGHTVETVWKSKSRKEVWTDEMRVGARENARRRWCAWHQVLE